MAFDFNSSAQWFEPTERKCTCGKRATGILRGTHNQDIGPRCQRCADKEIAKARKYRTAQQVAALRQGPKTLASLPRKEGE